jgi:hypothetical protein
VRLSRRLMMPAALLKFSGGLRYLVI